MDRKYIQGIKAIIFQSLKKGKKRIRRIYRALLDPTFNGEKIFSIFFLKRTIVSVSLWIMLLLFYDAVASDLQWHIFIKYLNGGLTYIKDILERNVYLNVSFATLILMISGYFCCKIYRNHYKSLSYYFITVFLLMILYDSSYWKFADFSLGGNYKMLLTFLIICPSVTLTIRIIVDIVFELRKRLTNNPDLHRPSFSNDNITVSEVNSVRRLYAESLVPRLLRINLMQESYTVGITGRWGAGKSTFLENIKTAIKGRAYIMDFNPWNSLSPKQINYAFFTQLSGLLRTFYKPLESELLSYSKILCQLSSKILEVPLDKLPFFASENLFEQKKKVSRLLAHIDKPIIIFIDDLDRLEKNEIFEVLRLVRNTAKFPNIIYILTLDKEYVSEQLKYIGVKDGNLYLEKIIPLEIPLPKIDKTDLIHTFKEECRAMFFNRPKGSSFLDSLSESDINLVVTLLSTYRKIKRFARSFAACTNFIFEQDREKAIDLHDLFVLELLHFHYPLIYERLWKEPKYYLDISIHSSIRVPYYVLRNRASSKVAFGTESDRHIEYIKDENLYSIMKNLFLPKSDRLKLKGIQLIDNYEDYFCLGIPKSKVSDSEFENMLQSSTSLVAKQGMISILRSWCWKKDAKRTASIYAKFIKYRFHSTDRDLIYNYVKASCFWIMVESRENEFIEMLLVHVLKKNNIDPSLHRDVGNVAKTYIKHAIDSGNNILIASILSQTYKSIMGSSDFILNNEDIRRLLFLNFKKVGQLKKWDAINLISFDGNDLNLLISNSSFALKNEDNNKVWENPIIEDVIGWFEEREIKSSHLDLALSMYDSILYKDGTKFKDLDLNNRSVMEAFQKIFGYTGVACYRRFLNIAFDNYVIVRKMKKEF